MQKQPPKIKANYTIGIGAFPGYVLVFFIFGLLILPLIQDPNLIATLIICGIVYWFLFYFNSLKISLFDDGFVFKKKKVLFNDIKKVIMNFNLGVKTPSGKVVPVYGICAYDESNSEPLVVIPAKLYSKKGLILFLNSLSKCNSNIQLDKFCLDMSTGDFGTISKAGLKKMLPWIIATTVSMTLASVLVRLFMG